MVFAHTVRLSCRASCHLSTSQLAWIPDSTSLGTDASILYVWEVAGGQTGALVLGRNTWGECLGEGLTCQWWRNPQKGGAELPFEKERLWLQGWGLAAHTGF